MSSYQYRDPHVKDYKNPLHLDVVDRYLRRMGDKTIPDEAPPSLESFYPPWVKLEQLECLHFLLYGYTRSQRIKAIWGFSYHVIKEY